MSALVERLAEKWARERSFVFTPETASADLMRSYEKHARFWLNAIADELGKAGRESPLDTLPPAWASNAVRWLREQDDRI